MLKFAALSAGIDEAGRGPLAGPVVAAAVCFPDEKYVWDSPQLQWMGHIDDSKKLNEKQREHLANLIKIHADYGFGAASVNEIDAMNILAASLLAMQRACKHLTIAPEKFWVDGKHLPQSLPAPADAIIRGDQTHLPIAAASILAKTLRDQLMGKLNRRYPHYYWHSNKGYGSKTHIAAIHAHGVTPHHRHSFAPIKNIAKQRAHH